MSLLRHRAVSLVLLPNLIFLAIIFAFGPRLISVLNVINFGLACGVVFAYLPVAWGILKNDPNWPMDRAAYLGLGIFLSWLATLELRTYSMVWRWMGMPEWLSQSDVLTYALFTQLAAAVLHLAAPEAINSRIPTRRWVNIGIGMVILMITAIAVAFFVEAVAGVPTGISVIVGD